MSDPRMIEVNLATTPSRTSSGAPSPLSMTGDSGPSAAGARPGRLRWAWPRVIGLVASTMLAGGWWLGVLRPLHVMGQERTRLREQLEQRQSDSLGAATLQQRIDALRLKRDSLAQRLAALQQLDVQRVEWAALLSELGRVVPEGVWLTELVPVGRDPLVAELRGFAADTGRLTRLMAALQRLAAIDEVELRATEARTAESDSRLGRTMHLFTLELRQVVSAGVAPASPLADAGA